MALLAKRKFVEAHLSLKSDDSVESDLLINHIFEPEFHQDIYKKPIDDALGTKGAFCLSDLSKIKRLPNRGLQPKYIDDENDLDSLIYIGMLDKFGVEKTSKDTSNVCALKSVSVRSGYVDFGGARSVSADFYKKNSKRAGVEKNDLLINSTGDGTIGRVAVYNSKHPAIVDGHITIVRFKDDILPWYVAAYLLSQKGQRQIYRYINGSSGQVEIYPQDIERLWIPGNDPKKIKEIGLKFKSAVEKYDQFQKELSIALSLI